MSPPVQSLQAEILSTVIITQFVPMLNIQFQACDDLFDKYVVKSGFNRSLIACIYQHCSSM